MAMEVPTRRGLHMAIDRSITSSSLQIITFKIDLNLFTFFLCKKLPRRISSIQTSANSSPTFHPKEEENKFDLDGKCSY